MTLLKKNILKNIILLYGLSIAKIVFPLLTLPYLTRVLSVPMYGSVSYVKAVMTYAQIFVDFGFMLSGTKQIVQCREDLRQAGRIAGSIMMARLSLSVVAAIFVCCLVMTLPILQGIKLFTFLSFGNIVLSIFLFDYLFRGLEHMEVVTSRYSVMKGLATVLTFVMIKSDQDVLWIPILDIIGSLLAIGMILLWLRKHGIRVTFGKASESFQLMKESLVYFVTDVASTAFNALNTLLIGIYLSEEKVAFWSISILIVGTIQALYLPIVDGIYPEMIKSRDFKVVKRILCLFTPLVVTGCILTYFLSPWAMSLLGRPEYAQAYPILRGLIPVLFVSFFTQIFGWPVLGAIGCAKEVTISTIISAVLQVAYLGVLAGIGKFTLEWVVFGRCVVECVILGMRVATFLAHGGNILNFQ